MKTPMLLLFLASWAIVIAGVYSESNDVERQVFGDSRVFNAFKSARHITATRLYLKNRDKPWELTSYSHGPAIRLSDAQIKQAIRLLSAPSTYSWRVDGNTRTVKPCLPNYGVLFTIKGDAFSPKIALCFECNTLAVFAGPDNGARRVNAEEDFDSARQQLIGLAQAIFPSDPQIRALN
jgi:hypothetical protein